MKNFKNNILNNSFVKIIAMVLVLVILSTDVMVMADALSGDEEIVEEAKPEEAKPEEKNDEEELEEPKEEKEEIKKEKTNKEEKEEVKKDKIENGIKVIVKDFNTKQVLHEEEVATQEEAAIVPEIAGYMVANKATKDIIDAEEVIYDAVKVSDNSLQTIKIRHIYTDQDGNDIELADADISNTFIGGMFKVEKDKFENFVLLDNGKIEVKEGKSEYILRYTLKSTNSLELFADNNNFNVDTMSMLDNIKSANKDVYQLRISFVDIENNENFDDYTVENFHTSEDPAAYIHYLNAEYAIEQIEENGDAENLLEKLNKFSPLLDAETKTNYNDSEGIFEIEFKLRRKTTEEEVFYIEYVDQEGDILFGTSGEAPLGSKVKRTAIDIKNYEYVGYKVYSGSHSGLVSSSVDENDKTASMIINKNTGKNKNKIVFEYKGNGPKDDKTYKPYSFTVAHLDNTIANNEQEIEVKTYSGVYLASENGVEKEDAGHDIDIPALKDTKYNLKEIVLKGSDKDNLNKSVEEERVYGTVKGTDNIILFKYVKSDHTGEASYIVNHIALDDNNDVIGILDTDSGWANAGDMLLGENFKNAYKDYTFDEYWPKNHLILEEGEAELGERPDNKGKNYLEIYYKETIDDGDGEDNPGDEEKTGTLTINYKDVNDTELIGTKTQKIALNKELIVSAPVNREVEFIEKVTDGDDIITKVDFNKYLLLGSEYHSVKFTEENETKEITFYYEMNDQDEEYTGENAPYRIRHVKPIMNGDKPLEVDGKGIYEDIIKMRNGTAAPGIVVDYEADTVRLKDDNNAFIDQLNEAVELVSKAEQSMVITALDSQGNIVTGSEAIDYNKTLNANTIKFVYKVIDDTKELPEIDTEDDGETEEHGKNYYYAIDKSFFENYDRENGELGYKEVIISDFKEAKNYVLAANSEIRYYARDYFDIGQLNSIRYNLTSKSPKDINKDKIIKKATTEDEIAVFKFKYVHEDYIYPEIDPEYPEEEDEDLTQDGKRINYTVRYVREFERPDGNKVYIDIEEPIVLEGDIGTKITVNYKIIQGYNLVDGHPTSQELSLVKGEKAEVIFVYEKTDGLDEPDIPEEEKPNEDKDTEFDAEYEVTAESMSSESTLNGKPLEVISNDGGKKSIEVIPGMSIHITAAEVKYLPGKNGPKDRKFNLVTKPEIKKLNSKEDAKDLGTKKFFYLVDGGKGITSYRVRFVYEEIVDVPGTWDETTIEYREIDDRTVGNVKAGTGISINGDKLKEKELTVDNEQYQFSEIRDKDGNVISSDNNNTGRIEIVEGIENNTVYVIYEKKN